MRIEGAYRNRAPGTQTQLLAPIRREMARDLVRRSVLALQLLTNTEKKRIHFDQEGLGRQSAQRFVPKPLVAHGADAALHLLRIGDTAQCGSDHVAMLEGRSESVTLFGIMPQPM